MWPFTRRERTTALRALAGIRGPTAVDIVATVTSADLVASPLSGQRAAALQIELFEQHNLSLFGHREILIATSGNFVQGPDESPLGVAILGDSLLLRTDDGAQVSVGVAVPRCTIASSVQPAKCPLGRLPAALVPLFHPTEGGSLWFRELALKHGERVRLRAVVAPAQRVVPTEYRSAAGEGFETRGDLGAVELERVDGAI
jgi:hypothetical protein